jgi:CDP-paratose 2-epimerase
MKILITGGAGFVGSNLAISRKRKCLANPIFCPDNVVLSGSELNLPLLKKEGVGFIHALRHIRLD